MDDQTKEAVAALLIVLCVIFGGYLAAQAWQQSGNALNLIKFPGPAHWIMLRTGFEPGSNQNIISPGPGHI